MWRNECNRILWISWTLTSWKKHNNSDQTLHPYKYYWRNWYQIYAKRLTYRYRHWFYYTIMIQTVINTILKIQKYNANPKLTWNSNEKQLRPAHLRTLDCQNCMVVFFSYHLTYLANLQHVNTIDQLLILTSVRLFYGQWNVP